jgi:exosortase A-associated hydrolase 2
MTGALAARFVGEPQRRLFVVSRVPERPRGCVLLVPAFGDEMNKSRHLLTAVAAGLASRGIAAVLVDLYGTGDSDGEFRDASWEGWLDDLRATRARLREEGLEPDRLLGVRTGALLALEAARRDGWSLARTVLWQPVVDGDRFVTQFLRMRVAARLDAADRETVGDLRKRLAAGEILEVGGYEITRAHVDGLGRARLADLLDGATAPVTWFETVASGGTVPPPLEAAAGAARERGARIDLQPVAGEPYWASSELVSAPALVAATVDALAEERLQ